MNFIHKSTFYFSNKLYLQRKTKHSIINLFNFITKWINIKLD